MEGVDGMTGSRGEERREERRRRERKGEREGEKRRERKGKKGFYEMKLLGRKGAALLPILGDRPSFRGINSMFLTI